jgi:hypothetical protein
MKVEGAGPSLDLRVQNHTTFSQSYTLKKAQRNYLMPMDFPIYVK